jgi:hypothetical protein
MKGPLLRLAKISVVPVRLTEGFAKQFSKQGNLEDLYKKQKNGNR